MRDVFNIHVPSEEAPYDDLAEALSNEILDIENISVNLINDNLRVAEDADFDITEDPINEEEPEEADCVAYMAAEPFMEVLTLSISVAENVGAAAVSAYLYEKLSERNVSTVKDSKGYDVQVDEEELKSMIENAVDVKNE